MYYVPEGMEYDNVLKGYVEESIAGSSISSCFKEKLPKKLPTRKAVWTEENGHAQIKGFKDPSGATVIKISIKMDSANTPTQITKVGDLTNIISGAMKSEQGYKISYSYGFYETNSGFDYTVVKISNGEDFVKYVDSLEKQVDALEEKNRNNSNNNKDKNKNKNNSNNNNSNEKAIESLRNKSESARKELEKTKNALNEYTQNNASGVKGATKEWYELQQQINEARKEIIQASIDAKNFKFEIGAKKFEAEVKQISNAIE